MRQEQRASHEEDRERPQANVGHRVIAVMPQSLALVGEDRPRPRSTPRSVARRRSPRPRSDDRSCTRETTACCGSLSRKPQHVAYRSFQSRARRLRARLNRILEWLVIPATGGRANQSMIYRSLEAYLKRNPERHLASPRYPTRRSRRNQAASASEMSEAVPQTKPESSVIAGNVDDIGIEGIIGWAWDQSNPERSVLVDVLDGETVVLTVLASRFRPTSQMPGLQRLLWVRVPRFTGFYLIPATWCGCVETAIKQICRVHPRS